jgi:hypothetical protein
MKYLLNLEKFKINNDNRHIEVPNREEDYYLDTDNDDSKQKFEEIRKKIEKDCSKFIKEMKETWTNLIFRGVSESDDKDIILKKVIKDRYPRDINIQIQDMFDFYAEKYFGKKIRSSGVFTTKVIGDTSEYGNAFIFFPKGDYEYYWNPNVSDLFSDLEYLPMAKYYIERGEHHLKEIFPDDFDILMDSDPTKEEENDWYNEKSEEAIDKFEDFMKNIVKNYKNGSLGDNKYQELIFLCDEYYLVNTKYLFFIYDMFDIEY